MTESERAERLHHHMYDTCEGIREHAERIVALEGLVADIWTSCPVSLDDCKECRHHVTNGRGGAECELLGRIKELGVPL